MYDFVSSWWDALNFNLQVFYAIALISAIALLFQVALSFFMDMDHELSIGDHDSGMGIFTVRGVTAFFTGFGWMGVILTRRDIDLTTTIFVALIVGSGLMTSLFYMMRAFMRLQSSGNMEYTNAVGQLASVYVSIPPRQGPGGQIELMLQGRLITAEALQKGTETISPGTKVKVIECIGASTLIVELIV
jgi:hypothetical protein